MESDGVFRSDLYRGTAAYYDRFRPPYPEPLFDHLCREQPVSGSGRLLDLACGTGQIAVPLSGSFSEVWAIDQETEFIEYGLANTKNRGITNVAWVTAPAEQVELDGPFDLITIGNAFHRLNRQLVAKRMLSWLRPGGAVALLWSDTPWHGPEPWQQSMADLLAAWTSKVGAAERVPAGWQEAMDRDPNDQVLRRAGFDYVGKFEFTVTLTWSVEALSGFVYSTSFLNREALGDKVTHFEQDLAELLRSFEPTGIVRETASYAYELAQSPN